MLWPLRRFQRFQVPLPGIRGRDQYACFYCLTLTLVAGKWDWLLAVGLATLASPQHYSGALTHGSCFSPGTRSKRLRWGLSILHDSKGTRLTCCPVWVTQNILDSA